VRNRMNAVNAVNFFIFSTPVGFNMRNEFEDLQVHQEFCRFLYMR